MSDTTSDPKDTEKDEVKSSDTPITLVSWAERKKLPYNSVVQICRKHSVQVFRFSGQSRAYERDLDRAFQTELSAQIKRLEKNTKLRTDRLALLKSEKAILTALKAIKAKEDLTQAVCVQERENLALLIKGLPNESMLKDLDVTP